MRSTGRGDGVCVRAEGVEQQRDTIEVLKGGEGGEGGGGGEERREGEGKGGREGR